MELTKEEKELFKSQRDRSKEGLFFTFMMIKRTRGVLDTFSSDIAEIKWEEEVLRESNLFQPITFYRYILYVWGWKVLVKYIVTH